MELIKPERKRIWENESFYAILDKYPVSPGHTLLISKEHVPDLFSLDEKISTEIPKVLKTLKSILDEKFKPDGYNIGTNIRSAAGQTVPHLHIHIIPRYKHDIDDPSGGVRFVIPQKGNYRKPGFIPKRKIKKSKVRS